MYKTTVTFTGVTGSPWYSVMYWDESGGTAANALSAVNTFWGSVDARMSTAVSWTSSPTVELVSAATGQITGLGSGTAGSGSGALTDSILPPATQALMRLRTGVYVAGREIRGRCFIPGLTEAGATDGNVTAAAVTVFQDAGVALLAALDSTLVVYSRKNASQTPVASTSVWNQFAVLRSRRD